MQYNNFGVYSLYIVIHILIDTLVMIGSSCYGLFFPVPFVSLGV